VTEQSQHYPRLCLGICLSGDLGASDFDTIVSLGDRSFELPPQNDLKQLNTIMMPRGNRLHGGINCIS
jgi:hypothetical protein